MARRLQYQIAALTLLPLAAPDVFADSWFQPWSTPQRDAPFEVVAEVTNFGVPDNGLNGWNYPLSEPVRLKPGLRANQQQTLAYVGAAPFPETVTESRWHQPWSEPKRLKSTRYLYQTATNVFVISEAITEDKWHQAWSEPVRDKSFEVVTSTRAFGVPDNGLNGWNYPWSEPSRLKSTRHLHQAVPFVFVASETITEDKWHQPWATPTRAKTRTPQQSLAWSGFTPAPSEDSWHQPWPTKLRGRNIAPQPAQPFAPQPPTVTEDEWHQPWSVPFRAKAKPPQQNLALVPVVVAADNSWQQPWANPYPQKRGLATASQQFTTHFGIQDFYPFAVGGGDPTFTQVTIYQPMTWVPVAAPDVNSADKWFQPWSLPVRDKAFEVVSEALTFGVPDNGLNGWQYPWAEPTRRKPQTPQQVLAWSGFTPAAVVVTEDWFQPLAAPLRKRLFPASEQQFTTHFGIEDFYPFTVGGGSPTVTRVTLYQSQTWVPGIIAATDLRWFQPWATPTLRKAWPVNQPVLAWSGFTPAANVFEDSWHQPWLVPTRRKTSVANQPSLAWGIFTPAVFEDSWHAPWPTPVRRKPWTANQLAFVPPTQPIVPFGWYGTLPSPASLNRVGLRVASQQFWAGPTFTPPITPDRWFAWLAEPVRSKPGLRVYEQRFLSFDPFPRPDTVTVAAWYPWLSEPVRQPKGLKAWLQHYLETPARVLPTTVTIIMNAMETNDDMMQAAVYTYNPAARARVSIIEVPVPGDDPVSIWES